MKTLIFSILLGLSATTLLAQHPYYPYEPGDSFEMAYSEEFAEMGGSSHTKVEFTTDTKSMGGQTYRASSTYVGDGADYELFTTMYFRIDKDGNVVGRTSEEQDEEITIPKMEDLASGYSWSSNSSEAEKDCKVLDTDATIVTPAATHSNCLVIQMQEDEDVYIRMYLKRNVGVVAIAFEIGGDEMLQAYLVGNK
ncbi:MAG: hypothetical protein AAF741_18465 [Bacteroidota bacterium]